MPRRCRGLSFGTIAGIFSGTAMMLAFLLQPSLSSYFQGGLFVLHPVLMTAAFCLFMPLGLLSYWLDLTRHVNKFFPDRYARRSLHSVLLMAATFCAFAGYLVAFIFNQKQGYPHMALNASDKTRTAHAFLGLFALGLITLQACFGMYKWVRMTRDNPPREPVKWHSHLGPAAWLVGIVTIGLAGAFLRNGESQMPSGVGFSSGEAAAIWAFLGVLVVVVFAELFCCRRITGRGIGNGGRMAGDGAWAEDYLSSTSGYNGGGIDGSGRNGLLLGGGVEATDLSDGGFGGGDGINGDSTLLGGGGGGGGLANGPYASYYSYGMGGGGGGGSGSLGRYGHSFGSVNSANKR